MTAPAPRRVASDVKGGGGPTVAPRVALHYHPAVGRFGDPKPFVHAGRTHVFFQTSPRPDGFDTMRWGHVVSDDLLTWTELPPALEPTPDGPDAHGCWTGSVIHEQGRFHAFYTGVAGPNGRHQTVCRAESDDLVTWRKDPANPLVVPGAPFAQGPRAAWRDPHVRRLPSGGFEMVLTAELDEGPVALRACVARLLSDDLTSWRIDRTLHHPGDVHRCECPELVPLDGRYLLLYSDYGVQARVADDPTGPFRRPNTAQLDDFRWYAAKTAASDHDDRRLVFAFAFDRIAGDGARARTSEPASSEPASSEPDDGSRWTWGGVMPFAREVELDAQGEPQLRPARELTNLRHETLPLEPDRRAALGSWHEKRPDVADAGVTLVGGADAPGGASEMALLRVGRQPAQAEVRATVHWERGGDAGLLLYADADVGCGYRVDLDRARADLTLRRLIPYRNPDSPILQRMPLPSDLPDEVELRALVDGTLLEVFIANRVAFTGRLYERPDEAWWGLTTRSGARFEGVQAWRLALPT